MPRRNLLLILGVLVLSLLCHLRGQAGGAKHARMLGTFGTVLGEIEANYVEPVDQRELFEAALNGMVGKLDQYSAYIGPVEYSDLRENLDQQFGGIGIHVALDEEKWLTVSSPLVGTPAYRAEIESGDRIVEIEGHSTQEMPLRRAAELLRGKPGSTVRLKLSRKGRENPWELSLQRAVIRIESVLGDTHGDDDRWNFLLPGENGLGYLRVISFGERTSTELEKALENLTQQGLRGLIIDLRNDPGGSFDAAVKTCDLFIDSGTIVSTRGRDGVALETFTAAADSPYTKFPLVLLVNGFSASASEILAACLQDHGRATIVGERTWGKGSVQHVIPLEGDQSALKLTVASYWRPSGRKIHRMQNATEDDDWGVVPNEGCLVPLADEALRTMIDVRRERDKLRRKGPDGKRPPEPLPIERQDPQFDRALEVLKQKLSTR